MVSYDSGTRRFNFIPEYPLSLDYKYHRFYRPTAHGFGSYLGLPIFANQLHLFCADARKSAWCTPPLVRAAIYLVSCVTRFMAAQPTTLKYL